MNRLFIKIVTRTAFSIRFLVPVFFLTCAIWFAYNNAILIGIIFFLLVIKELRSKYGDIQAWKNRKDFFDIVDPEELNKRYSLKKKKLR